MKMIENEYFTAQEAAEYAERVIQERLNNDVKFVYQHIRKAAENGEKSTYIEFNDKKITQELIQFLGSKGFECSIFNGDQRDPCNQLTIKWKKK